MVKHMLFKNIDEKKKWWPNKNVKIPTVIVKYVWNINKNQQQTNNEQPWKKWKHGEVHNGTYKPGKLIKYNEQHLKK